jgi:EmrB/QacA subfamily drug resistance transporter
MVTDAASVPQGTDTPQPEADPQRWRALVVLGVVQFILVLDATVVNVALPRIQQDLGFSRAGLAWVVNGYVLMAGGLLLLGGRLADIFGRRRLFMLGVTLFALASLTCGAASSPAMLIPARFVQGIGEALAAPAALGMIAMLFPDPAERGKAMGIWGGVSGIAAISGVIVSGLLTHLVSWRWIFFINLPFAVFGLVMVRRLVAESRMRREQTRLDFTGALTATAGLVLIVYGLLRAASLSWGAWQVLVPLFVGASLIVAMFLIEHRSAAPLIPLRFFTNRTRLVANFVSLLFGAAFFSYVFLATLYIQQVLGFTPLQAGLASVPGGIIMILGIGVATGMMPKLGVKNVLAIGFFGCAVGLLLLSRIQVDSRWLTAVLPPMLIFGLFMGIGLPAVITAALHKVTDQDSGLASGVQTTAQQVGSALGLALLVTLALRHARDEISGGALPDAALTNGYVLSFRVAAVMLIVGGVLVLLLLERVPVSGMPGAPAKAAPSEPTEATSEAHAG